jgi:hypothetical protein
MRSIFILLLMAFVAGCETSASPASAPVAGDPSVPTRCGAPLIIVVTPDLSGSTAMNRTPVVQAADLDELVERTVRCGGEIALGDVAAESDKPLLRLYVPQPSAPPAGPAGGRSPLLARQERERYAAELAAFRRSDSLRTTAGERDARAFRQRATALLARPRDAQRSDVNGAVARMALFLSEPGHAAGNSAWTTPPRKVATLISDAEETAHRHPVTISLGADVEFYVVNGEPVSDSLIAPLKAQRFESFTALVRHLLQ